MEDILSNIGCLSKSPSYPKSGKDRGSTLKSEAVSEAESEALDAEVLVKSGGEFLSLGGLARGTESFTLLQVICNDY